jgi:hypothetical protein
MAPPALFVFRRSKLSTATTAYHGDWQSMMKISTDACAAPHGLAAACVVTGTIPGATFKNHRTSCYVLRLDEALWRH